MPLYSAGTACEAVVSGNFVLYLDNCDNLGSLARGGRKIIVGLGGSATNDGGGGAAGAMGAGMSVFFDSALETVLDTVGFETMIADADLIFTGEEKIDFQSLRGKAVIGIARRAKKQHVPVIAVVGVAEGDMTPAYAEGVTAVFTINRLPQPLSESSRFTAENLAFAAENILRTLCL